MHKEQQTRSPPAYTETGSVARQASSMDFLPSSSSTGGVGDNVSEVPSSTTTGGVGDKEHIEDSTWQVVVLRLRGVGMAAWSWIEQHRANWVFTAPLFSRKETAEGSTGLESPFLDPRTGARVDTMQKEATPASIEDSVLLLLQLLLLLLVLLLPLPLQRLFMTKRIPVNCHCSLSSARSSLFGDSSFTLALGNPVRLY